ncbi:MAG: cysteine synthase A [Syntrophobacterales bacterium]|nr:cysteine synthase A [Syntrophobacterales bacterium]
MGKNVFNNVLEAIGSTPLIRINRLNPNPNVTIYAKWEAKNPGGSIKDRAALFMIEDAERKGLLNKDKIIIEATSGNTGIGLAIVSAVKGYRLILAMPETASLERQKILRALGAEILLTPGALGTDGAIEEVYRLVRENPDLYFMPDQFNNPSNPAAHYYSTGPEIFEQTDGKVDVVVATLGTSGTAMGLARALKERNPNIEIVAVEPYPGHKIQGLKNMKESYVPGIYDPTILDRIIHIGDEEAFEMARRLAKEEGIFAGMSSGAAMAAAVRIAKERREGTIVAILPDGGDRYLSTNLFTVMIEPDFSFYDEASSEKRRLVPIEEGKVRLFITGPPLDVPLNLKESRRFFVADLLVRFLKFKQFMVYPVIVLPDFDSRTIAGSTIAGMELGRYVRERIEDLLDLFRRFFMDPSYHFVKMSELEDAIIEQVKLLMSRGFAYEKLRSVYFDISKVPGYGGLSHIDPARLRPGKPSDFSYYEKLAPQDFALLKRVGLSELKQGIYMKTPWGNVIPTWHIAVTAAALGKVGGTSKGSVDIYLSSVEFLFPHLENVKALADALGVKEFSRIWLISEQCWTRRDCPDDEICDEISLMDLLREGYKPEEIRYWMLTTHYRKPLHASRKDLAGAIKGFHRIRRFISRIHNALERPVRDTPSLSDDIYSLEQGFTSALSDDLNVPQAMAEVFAFVRKVNPLIDEKGLLEEDGRGILDIFGKINGILGGIFQRDLEGLREEEKKIIAERERARKSGLWEISDNLRKELLLRGIKLIDTPKGTFWEKL